VISKPSRHCTVELQALPSRIGQVRRIVSAQLRYWHLDPLIDSAALGVTELLTNVHRHAEPDKQCRVEIDLFLDRLTVSVRDSDPRVPSLRRAESADVGGRGLTLVASVSESWGVRPHDEGGKVVWFTLQASAPVAQTSAPAVAQTPAPAVAQTSVALPTPVPSRSPHPVRTPAPAAARGPVDAVAVDPGAAAPVRREQPREREPATARARPTVVG
jgi:anti-sigma regulatory factor (Ser/Thr protein kinase)